MKNLKTDKMKEIGRMIALAERYASEGQMNLNKILEAVVYAQIRRASWNYYPKVTTLTMQAELAKCLDGLNQASVSADLVAVLETGQHALAKGRGADLLIEEAPDVFVCRTCGYTTLEATPRHCPDCGAWPGSFRKFVAFFNHDNAEPENPTDTLSLLQQNADNLKSLTEPLTEEQLAQKPNTDEWSIRDHIAHFYDTQVMLDTRVELMLQNDNPDLVALAVYEFATDKGRHPATAHEILEDFVSKRTNSVANLKSLPLKDLWRLGQHPEFGQLTILRQAAYLAYHEISHLSEIGELCILVS